MFISDWKSDISPLCRLCLFIINHSMFRPRAITFPLNFVWFFPDHSALGDVQLWYHQQSDFLIDDWAHKSTQVFSACFVLTHMLHEKLSNWLFIPQLFWIKQVWMTCFSLWSRTSISFYFLRFASRKKTG